MLFLKNPSEIWQTCVEHCKLLFQAMTTQKSLLDSNLESKVATLFYPKIWEHSQKAISDFWEIMQACPILLEGLLFIAKMLFHQCGHGLKDVGDVNIRIDLDVLPHKNEREFPCCRHSFPDHYGSKFHWVEGMLSSRRLKNTLANDSVILPVVAISTVNIF